MSYQDIQLVLVQERLAEMRQIVVAARIAGSIRPQGGLASQAARLLGRAMISAGKALCRLAELEVTPFCQQTGCELEKSR